MKKFVFISLILALAASVAFAQDEGSWSIYGTGEVSTLMNFVQRNADGTHVQPWVGASGYHWYDWYGGSRGTFGLKYSKGDVSAAIDFDINDNAYADVSFDNGTAAFQTNIALSKLFMKLSGTPSSGADFDPGRLWGYYKFLDGKIHLEAAVTSRDTNYWFSNRAIGDVFDDKKISIAGDSGTIVADGFMKVDHHTYFLADFAPIEGLNVGLMIPGIYAHANDQDNAIKGTGNNGAAGYINAGQWNGNHILLKDALKNTRFGAKYATGPVEVALQFALLGESGGTETEKMLVDGGPKYDELNAGLYLGGKYNISDEINAGLAIQFLADGADSEANQFAIGFSFGYNAGALNAGLEGGLKFRNNAKDSDYKDKGLFGLRPQIAYNIIENYLCLSLNAFFFFDLNKDYSKTNGLGYEITPELWFNVAGTGAGAGYYWPNTTAIIVRYKIGGMTKFQEDPVKDPEINAVDITFKWSF